MSNIKRPIRELNKQEFDDAYNEMMKVSDGKWERYPLPTKDDILNELLQRGEITVEKLIELKGN